MKTRNRRGVLLLIVLALLAMFGVLAIAFVILTGQTRRGADALRRVGQYDEQPDKVLNQAALDLFRGSNNHQSPLQAHNFLENLYGNEWYQGNMSGASAVIGAGQLIQFTFAPTLAHPEQRVGAVVTITFLPATKTPPIIVNPTNIVGTYSTHIVALLTSGQFQMAAFEGLDPAAVIAYVNANSPQCMINGMPYSGTGFGFKWPPARSPSPFSGASSLLAFNNLTDANGWEFALLPNHAAFPYTSIDPSYVSPTSTNPLPSVNWLNQLDPAGPGGANADYTAPDYQSMFLALRLTTPTGYPCGLTPIPSFHRPDLIGFWANRMANGNPVWNDSTNGPILQRKVMLRPMYAVKNATYNATTKTFAWSDTGTILNPGMPSLVDPINGPWDVDNDGDGYPDSIWIDPGYEVRSTSDGRLYKPLVAVLCVDLDGRLNLNAHGSTAQTQTSFNQNPNPSIAGASLMYGGGNNSLPAGTLPSGHLGWGPADINLSPVFAANPAEYPQLLTGTSSYNGRYVAAPVSGSAVDDLSFNKEFNYPYSYLYGLGANDTNVAGNGVQASLDTMAGCYGTPPDLQGMLFTGLDYRGQPIYGVLGGSSASLGSISGCYSALCGNWSLAARPGNPYELDLSLRQPRGLRSSPTLTFNPFSPAELEPILRPYDRDVALLPNRLQSLSPNCLGNASLGMGAKVTTDSWDQPCPAMAAPVNNVGAFSGTGSPATNLLAYAPGTRPSGSGTDGRIRHFTDLLKATVAAAQGTGAASLTNAGMTSMLPPDILSGLRMDINMPFGNGIDDNGNGVVDEPAEADSGSEKMPNVTPPTKPPTTPPSPQPATWPRMDYANQGLPATVADPRQMLFRYLYVLGMILTDPGASPPNAFLSTASLFPSLNAMSVSTTPPATAPKNNEIRARWIAQWAANVVSFRDRDSIMKPFAYDPNVLANGGWFYSSPSGSCTPPTPTTDKGLHIVFSCERPELLITETLAFHEKRTEVFSAESSGGQPTPTLMQRMKPQGSLYIELYNPWSATEAPPAEFYTLNNKWQSGVILGATTPQGDPVWRLIIPADASVSKMPITTDPDDPNVALNSATPFQIERSVYFTKPVFSNATVKANPGDGTEFYPSTTATNPTSPNAPYGASLPPLLHNHYALIGPPSSDSNGTWLSKSSTGTSANAAAVLLNPSLYQASQTPGQSTCPVQVIYNKNGANNDLPVATGNQQIKMPLPIVVDSVNTAGLANPPPRLSVSEPLTGYPQPNGGTDSTTGEPQYFTPPTSPVTLPLASPYLPPFDGSSPATAGNNPVTPVQIGSAALGTLFGVQSACRVVHLQRLANPLIPFDPDPTHVVYTADGEVLWKFSGTTWNGTETTYNPYRTIDSMPIDLTVYNGWETAANLLSANANEPPMTTSFHSRQRGDAAFLSGAGNLNNLWSQEGTSWLTLLSYPGPTTLANQMFGYQLQHTLGYLNQGYGTPTPNSSSTEYIGDPSTAPFPWLTWNNRPFCSQMELLLVPALCSSQLLFNYGIISTTGTAAEITAPVPATNPYSPLATGAVNQPFMQLMNYFYSTPPAANGAGTYPTPPPNPFPTPAQFYRVLEYLRVPSRFVGTELQLSVANNTLTSLPYCGDNSGTHLFHPPYNRISRYRDPGRINLNTLNDFDVWNGLMQSAPGLYNNKQAFANFLYSRKGYGAVNAAANFPGTLIEPNVNSPTYFANPFRSFEGSHLVPLDVLYQSATCQAMTPTVTAATGADINATLLRQDFSSYAAYTTGNSNPTNPLSASSVQSLNRPLFGLDGGIPNATPGSQRQYNNDQRNPYFRYEDLQRLGNLVTTRSNVFAVWITVGYFQVQKVPASALTGALATNPQFFFPDGYQIIGEMGADTGEVKRHRAFYIFDRSIPMGYQRGHDNNVSNGILLSRMIE